MDDWLQCWYDRDYKKKPRFITANAFWTAAKQSLCQKYAEEPNVLSFLDNMLVLQLVNDAATRTTTQVSPFSGFMTNTTSGGVHEYTVSLVMKDRRNVDGDGSPLPLPYAYEFVYLEHNHCINNIYVVDGDYEGYNMWELISDNDTPGTAADMQYQKFMNIMMSDADKITHEQMADIFQRLFDFFPVQVDF